jgi:glycosyltransferase involved in cell wall biosynthesis
MVSNFELTKNEYNNMLKFKNSPTISIILPVFNRKHLIGRAIESVENQSFSDWELLIIDDGSTDGLETLILPQVKQNPKWRYMAHSNRKSSQTRNVGIHAAVGDYITFLDSDDEYTPDHLKRRVDYFRKNPDVDIIHGGVELVGPDDTHFVKDVFDPLKIIHISDCCVGATFFGKREAFLASGGFKMMEYSAESELLPRLESRFVIKKVDYPTYRYYTGLEDSICTLQKKAK